MSDLRDKWSTTSPSFLIAAALAVFMFLLAILGLLAPSAAAHGFGLPLANQTDAVWLRIKGDRDLSAALGMGVFLALRMPRALGAFLLASIPSPALDLASSLAAPTHNTIYALAVHGGAALLVAGLGITLVRQRRFGTGTWA